VFDFHLDDDYTRDTGAICGGSMRILIDPTAVKDRESYAQAAESLEVRERGVLLTTVRAAAETAVTVEWYPEEDIPPEVGFPGAEAVRLCLARERPALFVDDSQPDETVEVLVEPVIPEPVLLIVGGGHVGQALARQAVLIGFDVTVVDDRPEFTNPALFPEGVGTLCGNVPKKVAAFHIAEDTYIVVVTRGHKHDAEALEACIHSRAAYIGMIGSKRKVTLIREKFLESGIATEEEFGRVFAPIGLDIGAVTVGEIATSIAAQLVAVRRKGRDHTPPGDMVLR
jgi:xanthine dehydrogenase accessory factor